ncbi:hypothetical protein CH35J_012316 [Colletotrichum higginsianum]|nr:hypothetical protein CH35J_012316 [Colletotrichum higginsianum]
MGNQKRSKTTGFAFVMTDTSGRPNSEDRKLIRSHVMRGKNTRASRAAPKRAAAPWAAYDIDTAGSVQETESPEALPIPVGRPGSEVALRYNDNKRASQREVLHASNDLDMFRFAEDVDDISRSMLFEYYGFIKETMYPIEWCLSFDASKTPWFYWLLSDAAFLNSMLFTVGLLHDSVEGKTSKRTNFHVWRTLKLLNKHITDKDLALADSTIATVVSMCMVSEIFGDRDGATAHVRGLRRIVELRGGIESFGHNLQLQVKICRVDIGWSLCTGEKPLYYRDGIDWGSSLGRKLGDLPAGFQRSRDRCRIRLLADSFDPRLGNVFQDLHDFSLLANYLAETGQKIEPHVFQNLMTSVQYRLLYLEPATRAGVADMFRLGMSSYITTLFLKVHGAKIPLAALTSQLRSVCRQFEVADASTAAVRLLVAWTLVTGAISVFDGNEDDDAWLIPKLASLRDSLGATWPEAEARLGEVMWVELAHSSQGVKVFEKLVLHVAKVPPTKASPRSRWRLDSPASSHQGRFSSTQDVVGAVVV